MLGYELLHKLGQYKFIGPDHIHASVGELASVTMRLLSMVFEKLWRLEDVYKTGRKVMPPSFETRA